MDDRGYSDEIPCDRCHRPMINEYAVKGFPMVLELLYLWWSPPSIPELGECDIPRIVTWEGVEYEFMAAILHSADPGHWSSRVLYRDHLYSGQAEGDSWGPWLAQVNRSAYDTAAIAWKMTSTELGSSYPTRLYFVKRTLNSYDHSNSKDPEGRWFRLNGSTNVECPAQLSQKILPTLPLNKISKREAIDDDTNHPQKRVKRSFNGFTGENDVIQVLSSPRNGDDVSGNDVLAPDTGCGVKNETPVKAYHSISTVTSEENASFGPVYPVANNSTIFTADSEAPSMTQTTGNTTDVTQEKTSTAESRLKTSERHMPDSAFRTSENMSGNRSPPAALVPTSSPTWTPVSSNSERKISVNPFESPAPLDEDMLEFLKCYMAYKSTRSNVNIAPHVTFDSSPRDLISFQCSPSVMPAVSQLQTKQGVDTPSQPSVPSSSNDDLKRSKTITPSPSPNLSNHRKRGKTVVDLTIGDEEFPKRVRRRSGTGVRNGQQAKNNVAIEEDNGRIRDVKGKRRGRRKID